MIGHKPECPANWGVGEMPEGPCTFCEMLRACEQRVREEIDREAFVLDEGDPFRQVYRKGLDAAQDAVAAISGHSTWPDMSYNDGLIDALAAIDAIREKP